MKEVVLDTETTGLDIKDGHRIVEIGCIEIENLIYKFDQNLLLIFMLLIFCRYLCIR